MSAMDIRHHCSDVHGWHPISIIVFSFDGFYKIGHKLSQLILNIEDSKTGILNKSIIFSLPTEF